MTIKHFFPVKSIKFQLENLEKVEFNGFLWLTISEIFQISAKYARLKQISSMFLYSKHLEATHSSFVFLCFLLVLCFEFDFISKHSKKYKIIIETYCCVLQKNRRKHDQNFELLFFTIKIHLSYQTKCLDIEK